MHMAMSDFHDLNHVELLNPDGSLRAEAAAWSIRCGGYYVYTISIFPISLLSDFGWGL